MITYQLTGCCRRFPQTVELSKVDCADNGKKMYLDEGIVQKQLKNVISLLILQLLRAICF